MIDPSGTGDTRQDGIGPPDRTARGKNQDETQSRKPEAKV